LYYCRVQLLLKKKPWVNFRFDFQLRTLGTEMTTERTRAAAARKQLEESLARQTAEMQMLSVRLQQTTEQHVAEVNALRVAVQQAQKASQTSEEHLRQLQRLQDEKNQFDARFATAQQMQQEMGARVQQLEDFLMHKQSLAASCKNRNKHEMDKVTKCSAKLLSCEKRFKLLKPSHCTRLMTPVSAWKRWNGQRSYWKIALLKSIAT
jgi:chromosome segregation ATPase